MTELLPMFQVAWGNLITAKLRSALAALGIIIGVATVVALVSVGEGARQRVLQELRSLGTNLVLVSPGPGGQLRLDELSWIRREIPVAQRLVPGIPEAMRREGAAHTPRAMLTRAVAVARGGCLIVNLPGSPRGVRENLGAVLEALGHAVELLRGGVRDCARPED